MVKYWKRLPHVDEVFEALGMQEPSGLAREADPRSAAMPACTTMVAVARRLNTTVYQVKKALALHH